MAKLYFSFPPSNPCLSPGIKKRKAFCMPEESLTVNNTNMSALIYVNTDMSEYPFHKQRFWLPQLDNKLC